MKHHITIRPVGECIVFKSLDIDALVKNASGRVLLPEESVQAQARHVMNQGVVVAVGPDVKGVSVGDEIVTSSSLPFCMESPLEPPLFVTKGESVRVILKRSPLVTASRADREALANATASGA